ncbi:MAG: 50S ribosomal protein L3 [Patescibacteria group bacterium]
MKIILGKKMHMTQIFDDAGKVQPATIVSAGPIVVTQVKTKERDGYSALQVGYGTRKAKNISKPVLGHTKELGNFSLLKEFRLDAADLAESKVGDSIKADAFSAGDKIVVTAISKGKGFQGVVKRHGFHGGPRSHGQKHSEREAGSIGGGLRNKVPKGMRMAGRMGGAVVSVKGLKVLQANAVGNLILVSGAIPGRRGTVVEIRGV